MYLMTTPIIETGLQMLNIDEEVFDYANTLISKKKKFSHKDISNKFNITTLESRYIFSRYGLKPTKNISLSHTEKSEIIVLHTKYNKSVLEISKRLCLCFGTVVNVLKKDNLYKKRDDVYHMEVSDIAKYLNVSKSTIRTDIKSAMAKIKKSLISRGIDSSYLYD